MSRWTKVALRKEQLMPMFPSAKQINYNARSILCGRLKSLGKKDKDVKGLLNH